MGRRGFVISMDLMVAVGVVLVMLVMLTELSPYKWNRYSYTSDAIFVLEQQGVKNESAFMTSKLASVLPSESYNFTLVDFGSLTPLDFCSSNADCPPAYPVCIFYLCAKTGVNIQTGEYVAYSSEPLRYCSQQMISERSCKPDGDMSQRMYVELGDDDIVDNFYIMRLEVAN